MKFMAAIALCLVVATAYGKPPPNNDPGAMQKLITPPISPAVTLPWTPTATGGMLILNKSDQSINVTVTSYSESGSPDTPVEVFVPGGAVEQAHFGSTYCDPDYYCPSVGYSYYVVTWLGKEGDVVLTNCVGEKADGTDLWVPGSERCIVTR